MTDPADNHDLISRLYDVALDPSRYEELLDQWEAAMGPLRREADPGFLDDGRLSEHVSRANAVLDKIGTGDSDELGNILSQFDRVAALILDADLAVAAMNLAARSSAELSRATRLSELQIEPQDLDALTRRVRQMLQEADSAPAVFRVRSRKDSHFLVFHLRRYGLRDGTPVIIAVTSHLSWPAGFSDILSEAFGLTRTETTVIRELIDCASVREIAERRGRSVDTIRAQLKSILAKTEAKSQVELVRLVLSMMEIAGLTRDEGTGPALVNRGYSALRPRSFETVTGPDGRKLDYLRIGTPAGRPLLYLPLDYGFTRWPARAEAWAEENGLNVVVPVRAGYGGTDPAPTKESFTDVTLRDLRAVLAAESIARCPVLTLGTDIYYACHMEQAHPGTFSAIFACAGSLPITRPEQYERMDKYYRFILAGARYTPRLLPFMVKAGFHLARKNGKRAFLYSVFGKSEADVQTFEDPEVFEALITGTEVALSSDNNAHSAFARQVIEQETRDWRDVVRAMQDGPPIQFFNGLQDPQTHPDTLKEFQEDFPWIRFDIRPDAGQLYFFQHWNEVLPRLLPYCEAEQGQSQ